MTERVAIRDARPSDLAALHALNAAATPAVGDVTEAELARLVGQAAFTGVAEHDGRPAGFILCLTEGAAYASLNYAWIAGRYPAFAYCDRIAVDATVRGHGLGAALYEAAVDRFRGRRPVLTCEVNLAPPNPGSLRFHERLGFRRVGERWSDGGTKGVVYMEKSLLS